MSDAIIAGLTPPDRIISLGNAPASQTGAGGLWVNAWSYSGVSAVHKADASNAAEAWTAVKYTDLLSSTLAGGDIYRGDLGVSGQSLGTSTVRQEVDGREALRFNLSEAAHGVNLSLASFFANDDGTGYSEAMRIRLFDADGNLIGEHFVTADSLDGNQQVQLDGSANFTSIELSAGAERDNGSFAFGAYNNPDGSFGSNSYTSGSKHGSDFLLHAISFALARPQADGDSYTLDEDTPAQTYTSVLANDRDPNGQPLSAVLEQGPSHGTLKLNADGSFIYQPDADYNGDDSFSYHASNGKDSSDTAIVQLTIKPVNDAPVAVNDRLGTVENVAVSGNVIDGTSGGKDTDKDGDTLVVSNPGTFVTALGATVTLQSNGDFVYNPLTSSTLQALQSGDQRNDGFDYTINDGHGGSSSAHVTVQVSGLSDTSGGMLPSTDAGSQLSYYMRYTDSAGKASGWMSIDGYSWSGSAAVSSLKGLGSSTGKATPDAFSFQLGSGMAQASFTSALMQGTGLASVEIEAYSPNQGGVGQVVQEYKFSTVYATGISTSSNQNGQTGNDIAFVYKTVDSTLTPLDSQGKPVAPIDMPWNVPLQNTDLLPSQKVDTGADAQINRLLPDLASSTQLDYYVHIDGLSGWVKLDGFSMGFNADSSFLKGSGAAVGKPEADAVTLALGQNPVLAKLINQMVAGRSVNLQIESYLHNSAAGRPQLIDEFFFNRAYVSGFENSNNAQSDIELAYSQFTHAHQAYDTLGRVDSQYSTRVGYDLSTLTSISPPAPTAEALSAPLTDTQAGTPLSYYLRYTDSAGKTSGWMSIDGFSWAGSADVTILKGAGASVSKPLPQAFSFQLGTGQAQASFANALFKGAGFDSVEIEAYTQGQQGNGPVVQEYKFGNAYATKLQTSSNSSGQTSNDIAFVYKTVDSTLAPLDNQGKLTQPVEIAWNVPQQSTSLQASEKVSAGADAQLNHLLPDTPTNAELDYYVHADGVNGWVKLDGFSMGFSADSSFVKGTGAAVGNPVADTVTLELGQNQVLAKLVNQMIAGRSANLQIEAYQHNPIDGQSQLVDEYFFNQAYVSKFDNSTDANSSLALAYNQFSHAHQAYDTRGRLDSSNSTKVGYDLALLQPVSVPNPSAEALKAPLLDTLAGTPLTYYLRYTDLTGKVSGWMAVDSFSWDVTASISNPKGVGISAGKATPEAFHLQLGTGPAQASFTTALLKGTGFTSVEMEAYSPVAHTPGQVVQEYKFSEVLSTKISTSSNSSGQTSNDLAFVFKTVDSTLTPLDNQGKPGPSSEIAWNVAQQNTDLQSSQRVDPGADAQNSKLVPDLPTSAPLAYYVHVDGINGWIKLDGFSMGFAADSSFTKGTGTSVGKPAAEALTLALGQNQVLADFINQMIPGRSVNLQIEAYKSSPGSSHADLVDEYFFNRAYVSEFGNATDAESSLALVYNQFTHAHLAYDDTGKVNNAYSTKVGYDLTTLQPIGVPTPVADALH